ncbi:hypothetical protein PG985_015000 [Apiospora marii]|uniref:uncharacterized protein n=1 Tax=Apiospora marii TaxID=335849 RepID=UPI00312CF9A6
MFQPFFLLSPSYTGAIWVILPLSVLALSLSSPRVRSRLNDLLSAGINEYLLWRYPIRHTDLDRNIPTCPYRFPNGQGDVGKFLKGLENSERWETKYGSVYRIWSGMRGEIVITRPDQLQTIFKDSDKHFKAVNNNSGYLMGQVLGKCLGLISGQEWKAVRAAIEQPFLRRNASNYVDMVEKHVIRYMEDLHLHGALDRGLLDPAEDLKLLPFWVVAEIIYGELSPQMTQDLRELAPLREALFRKVIAGGVSRFSFSRYLPTQANQLLAEFQGRWRSFNDGLYSLRKASKPEAPPIVHLYDRVLTGSITMDQMLQTLDESLYANLDVTIGAISWNLVFLAAYPQYQKLLVEELATHLAGEKSRQQYILSNSTLLAACVSESSRLRPLAAFSVPQSAPTPRVVDGYMIPGGVDFIVDSYGLNVRHEFWGPRLRVLPPRAVFGEGGFGNEIPLLACMGKYVADIITRQLIVHIVEHYRLSLLEKTSGWARDPETWINHPKMQIQCTRK